MSELERISEIFGLMLGDGWVSYSKKNNTFACGFSGGKEDLATLKEDLMCIFGNIGKATIFSNYTFSEKYNISGYTNQFSCNVKVARYFINLGMPVGKRVEKEYCLPDWITDGDIKIKQKFICGLYAAEGTTPYFQSNGKTLKAMDFSLSKREELKTNGDLLASQIKKILHDIGVEINIKTERVYTKDWNIKYKFVLCNEFNSIMNTCNFLEMKYCKRKSYNIANIKKYYQYKNDVLENLKLAYECAMNKSISAKKVASDFNITLGQVESWRRRKTGYRIPNNFPTFNEFTSVNGLTQI